MGFVMVLSGIISLPLRQINSYEMKRPIKQNPSALELRPLKE